MLARCLHQGTCSDVGCVGDAPSGDHARAGIWQTTGLGKPFKIPPPSSSSLHRRGTRIGGCDKIYTVWRLDQCATLGHVRSVYAYSGTPTANLRLHGVLSWSVYGERVSQRCVWRDLRSTAELAKDIAALRMHNAKLQASLDSTAGLNGQTIGQVRATLRAHVEMALGSLQAWYHA